MSRYIGDISPIYRVSGGVDMIFREEKSRADISINIAKISMIYRRYITDIPQHFPPWFLLAGDWTP